MLYLLDQNIRNHFKCAFVFGFFFLNRKVSAPQVETRKYIKTFSYITQMKLTEIRFAVCFFVDLAKSNFKNNEIATDFVFRAGSLS